MKVWLFLFGSFEMVSDGKYHMVELIAIKKNFTLRVDRGLARSIINEGTRDFLHLTTPLFIGGVPPEAGQEAFTQWHLRNLTSFSGMLMEFRSQFFKWMVLHIIVFTMKNYWVLNPFPDVSVKLCFLLT